MKKEIWKDIQGYEGLYQVSNLGNIKSLNKQYNWLNVKNNKICIVKRKVKLLSTKPSSNGYVKVLLKNKLSKYRSVHRLVATAFILNPRNLPEVNHKNGIKNDNQVGNLEWVTKSENILHSFRVLNKRKKLNPITKKVRCIETGIIYKSITQAAHEYNITPTTLCGTLKHRLIPYKDKFYPAKTAAGKHWEYINEN